MTRMRKPDAVAHLQEEDSLGSRVGIQGSSRNITLLNRATALPICQGA